MSFLRPDAVEIKKRIEYELISIPDVPSLSHYFVFCFDIPFGVFYNGALVRRVDLCRLALPQCLLMSLCLWLCVFLLL